MNPNYKNLYVFEDGTKKRNGIYSPAIDRFILVDDYDYHVTLQTTELLTSKLSLVAWVLPPGAEEMTNDNCLNYTFVDKTTIKVGQATMSQSRHITQIKFGNPENKIYNAGPNPAFAQGDSADTLGKLIEYANYVHTVSYAISIIEPFMATALSNTKRFGDAYVPSAWTANLELAPDRTGLDKGILFELKHILYMSDSIEEATGAIIDVWKNNPDDKAVVIYYFYYLLGVEIPEELKFTQTALPKTISWWLF